MSVSESTASALYRGRFAPSPTGQLHFGSLVAALGSWLRARACGGSWLVRVEDIDPPREVPGSTQDILATLDAFGLQSDEPVMYQSRRSAAYAAALAHLQATGVAFQCGCSRADLQATAGIHRGACVAAPDPARPAAWRVRVPSGRIGFRDGNADEFSQDLARDVGDFVVQRVEGYYAYQLAVVVDDADQGITEVVRGADLLDSTPRQIWLQQQLGLPRPAYLHLPLVLDRDGRKLSKQDRALPVRADEPLPALRRALEFLGFPASFVLAPNTLPRLLADAVGHFDTSRLPRAHPVASIVDRA